MYFQQPQFLWGFLFLLIPLLVHLIQFRKLKTFYFPGIYRLTEIAATTRKSRNIKHWLILLSRLLVFTFLILGFAAPSSSPLTISSTSDKNILIIDASPSMWLKGESGLPIEKAKQKAISWIKSNGNSINYAIVTGGKSLEQHWYSGSEAIQMIRNIQNELIPTPIVDFDRIIQPLIQGENKSSTSVYFFTDAKLDVFNQYEKLNTETTWNVIQVGSDDVWQNFAIDSASVGGIASDKLKCWISRSTGTGDALLDLKIVSQKKLVGIQKLAFAENQTQIEIEFILPKVDLTAFDLVLEDAALQYDNILYCHSFNQRRTEVVLTNADAYFRNLIQVQSAKFQLIQDNTAKINNRAIRLFNPNSNLNKTDWEKLTQWAQDGSTVIISPEKMIDLALPSDKNAWITVPQEISNQGLNNAIFDLAFSEKIEENTILPSINGHLKLSNQELNNWEVVLSLKNGDPLLVYRTVGDGEIWLWLSDIQSGSAKFFQSSWFVPVFTQIMLGKNGLNYPIFGRIQSDYLLPVPKEFGLNINQPIALKIGKDEWSSSLAYGLDGLSINTGIESNIGGHYTASSVGVKSFFVGLNFPFAEKSMTPLSKEVQQKLEKSNFNFVTELDFVRSLSTTAKTPSLSNWFFMASLFFVLMELILLLFTFRTKQVNSQPQS